ncbi:heavy metal translocating P-type ATPase [Zavarzinia sp. CC-PAN008]|uniref:heavy metal translocating P-type ATPase n=1 Tax=Zavarzinia sp. CC-PAN008 TaxID=3243332 RepID=UPI003F74A5B8
MNALARPPEAAQAAAVALFNVPGIHCAGCIAKIERSLKAEPGIVDARVNFTTRRVSVAHLPDIDLAGIHAAIERTGFAAEPFAGEAQAPANAESRRLVKALAVAGFAAMNIMLLSVSVWSGADGATRDLFHLLSGIIALPTVAYAGRPFFASAWAALRQRRTNMDVPISIGVLMACGISVYETATSGPHAYFDGAVMLLFFLLAGRFLDSVMRARAQDGVAALMRQTASGAFVRAPDGTLAWRKADELAPNMRISVAAGERLAADGIVEEGASQLDRALITGESRPEPVAPGARVLAGTLNLDAPLVVKVTAAGPDTVIADIARLMEAAGQAKSRYVRLADRAARWYAPAVHTLAALALVTWLVAGAGLHQAILIAIAVLIITCPCALGLAVPVSQVVAAGALMRAGILIKDGSALERLAEVDTALFDKTGTLTLGRPVPVGDLGLAAAEKPAALALAQASRHPLSRALAQALVADGVVPATLTNIREVPGQGVEGMAADASGASRLVRLGRPSWLGLQDLPPLPGSLVIAFRAGTGPVRVVPFDDAPRPDALAALERVKALGLRPVILSGDRAEAVEVLAASLDVEGHAALLPQDKVTAIQRLAAAGHRVVMVGDGLNDGPALKAAHVSLAPSSASDVGQTAADMLFLGDGLMPVPRAVAAARRTMRVVRQNIALAIVYNVVAVPLAFAGLVTPLVAALAMSGSSLIVVANALRLRRAAR